MSRERIGVGEVAHMFLERGLGHVKPGNGMPRMVGEREEGKDEQGRWGVGYRIAPFFASRDSALRSS